MRVSVVAVSAVAALVIVYGVKWYAAARLSSIRLEPLAPAQTAQSADARRIDAGLSSHEHQQRVLHVSGSTGFEPLSSFMLRTQQFVAGALWRTAHHSLCTNVHASPEYEFRECSHGGGTFDAAVWTLLLGSRPRLPASQQSSPGPTMSRLSAAHDALLRTDACAFAPPSGDSHTVCTTHRATRKADSARAAANRSHAAVLSPVALVSRIIARNHVFAQVGEKEFVAVGSGALPPPDPAPYTPRTRRGAIRQDSSRRRAAFVYAAHNLPQPFAIVESGTLCGATTLLLAALKRAHCPTCPFYSLDPGGFRATKGQPLSCARDAIAAAGYTHPAHLTCMRSLHYTAHL